MLTSLQYQSSVYLETSRKSSVPVIDILRDRQTSLQYRLLMYSETGRQVFNTDHQHNKRSADKSSILVVDVLRDRQTSHQYQSSVTILINIPLTIISQKQSAILIL